MKILLLILLTSLTLNCFATSQLKPVPANKQITLSTKNSVLYSTQVDLVSATLVMLDLANLVVQRGGAKYPIYLVLDSPGGSIYAGENFIQFAKTISNLHTITINAASMASAIAMALPGKRYITEHGEYMFHRAQISLSGQVSDGEFESRLRSIKKLIKKLESRNAKRLNMSLAAYKEKVKDEWWVDAEEALKINMADAIADIKCTPQLIKKEISETVRTMFGNAVRKRSACPLIP